MAATAYYQNRERAFNRTNRIHRDINRASAYILDTDAAPISSTYSMGSARSSSLTRDAPRYVDPSNAGYRFKDKFSMESLRRTTNIPIQVSSPTPINNLSTSPKSSGAKKMYPKDFNPYSETARYKREQEMKDIHDEFMKNWNMQQNKMNGNEEKKTKSYHKIMGSTVSAIEDRDFTRQTIGDIFKDMGKFSTKTVAALNSLDTQGVNKNKNYNWRKEIEKYETTGQLERDARIRNIEIRNKRNANEAPPSSNHSSRIRRDESAPAPLNRSNDALPPAKKPSHSTISRIANEAKIEIPSQAKESQPPRVLSEPKKDIPVKEPVKEVTPTESTSSADRPMEIIKTPESSSKKRTKIVKKKVLKKNDEKVDNDEEKVENVNTDAVEQKDEKEEETKESSKPLESSDATKGVEEEEDVHGTKKMKDDFTSRMSSLDAEMTEGRSKLAKIRERIRKAKQGLMEIEI